MSSEYVINYILDQFSLTYEFLNIFNLIPIKKGDDMSQYIINL